LKFTSDSSGLKKDLEGNAKQLKKLREEAKLALADIRQLAKEYARMQKASVSGQTLMGRGGIGPKDLSAQRDAIGSSGKKYQGLIEEINSLSGVSASAKKSVSKDMKGLNKIKLDDFKSAVGLAKGAFVGFGMSIMFLGMQIQKIFMDIARSTVDTFLKIKSSAGPSNTAVEALAANFDYLKFAVGEAISTALEPFMSLIFDIVDDLVNWVSQHEELTAALIGFGIVIGSVLFFGGQLTILLAGIIAILFLLASAVSFVVGLLGWELLIPILLLLGVLFLGLIAIVALAVAAWESDIGGFATTIKSVFGKVFKFLGIWFNDILKIGGLLWEGLIALFEGDGKKVVQIVKKIVAIAVSNWEKFRALLVDITIDLSAMVLRVLNQLGHNMVEVYAAAGFEMAKALVKPLAGAFQFIANMLSGVVIALGSMGIHLPELNKIANTFRRLSNPENLGNFIEKQISGISEQAKIGNDLVDSFASSLKEFHGVSDLDKTFADIDKKWANVLSEEDFVGSIFKNEVINPLEKFDTSFNNSIEELNNLMGESNEKLVNSNYSLTDKIDELIASFSAPESTASTPSAPGLSIGEINISGVESSEDLTQKIQEAIEDILKQYGVVGM